ncbi:MAG: hypothetical protein JO364_19745 [Pseudonocardiales bacterium]|nr:hypothetical protein [Pseudonocardiales bacterium]MBV9032492.1 hypothetical protein [Pseudonocardiales bacterium]
MRLCLSQDRFAAALGSAKRTVGNAERGAHSPSLALRRALNHTVEQASDVQHDRFLVSHNDKQRIEAATTLLLLTSIHALLKPKQLAATPTGGGISPGGSRICQYWSEHSATSMRR